MARQGSMFRLTIALIIIIIIVLYVVFNTRLLIKGPQVEIYDLQDGQKISEELVVIKGKATDISFISLNDRQIFIDEDQMFNEKMLLTNRVNKVEVYAKDKFGKEKKERLFLIRENL